MSDWLSRLMGENMKIGITGILILVAALVASEVSFAQTKLRVTYYPIRDNKLALWMAQDAGFFKMNGLDVSLISEPDKGETTIKALLAGDTDMAGLGFRDAISFAVADGNVRLVVIAGLALNPFVFIANPEIKSPQDLKGKKVWTAA